MDAPDPPPPPAPTDEQRFAAHLATIRPWATIGLAGSVAALFLLQVLWGRDADLLVLVRMGANLGREPLAAEPFRLLASAFLHADLKHLLFNGAALVSLGPLLERVLGVRRFLLLYALTALGGSVASALAHDRQVSVGASGALWGLMAAGGGLALRPRGLLPPAVAARLKRGALTMLAINGAYSLLPGVDRLAHLGGGLVGLLLLGSGALTAGLPPAERRLARPASPRSLSAILAALALVAMAGSVGAAIAAGRPWELRAPPPPSRIELGATGVSIEVRAGMRAARDGGNHTFGSLARDPLVVEIAVDEQARPMAADELPQALEELRRAFGERPSEGATVTSAARIVRVGGIDAVEKRETLPNGVGIRTWLTRLHHADVLVRTYTHPHAPPAWRAIEESFVVSLRHAGRSGDEAACEAGGAAACRRLGWTHGHGLGVPVDAARAAALFGKACDGGDARGCALLAHQVGAGEGVARDPARAAALHRRACDAGDLGGCHDLGIALLHGEGVAADPAGAAALFAKVCEADDPSGCNALALLLDEGHGIAKDEPRAAELYRRACDGGKAEACTNLGGLYADGRGVARDPARAAELRRRGCEAGDPLACKLAK